MATKATVSLDHGPSGFVEVRITTFCENGGAIHGEVALEIGVPRNAENVGIVEEGDGVAKLRGPIAVAGVETPGVAILRAQRSDLSQSASVAIVAPVSVERSVVNKGRGTESGLVLRKE